MTKLKAYILKGLKLNQGLKKADLLNSTENAVGVTGVKKVSYGVRKVPDGDRKV